MNLNQAKGLLAQLVDDLRAEQSKSKEDAARKISGSTHALAEILRERSNEIHPDIFDAGTERGRRFRRLLRRSGVTEVEMRIEELRRLKDEQPPPGG